MPKQQETEGAALPKLGGSVPWGREDSVLKPLVPFDLQDGLAIAEDLLFVLFHQLLKMSLCMAVSTRLLLLGHLEKDRESG